MNLLFDVWSPVHRQRPQPQLPARHPPPRGLARGLEDPQAHPGQSLLLAEGENRDLASPLLLFEDEERKRRDPIRPAKPSASAQEKKRSHETADGLPVHSFETLLAELASRARVTYEFQSGGARLPFRQVPEPTPLQARAYELIRKFPVTRN
jgi:hypothetical protein